MKLTEAEAEIIAALGRLLEKPKAHRPFVIIEHAPRDVFVQFAGSDSEPLLIDCPALGVSEPCSEISSAASRAVRLLRLLGVVEGDELSIEENAGGSCPS